MKTAKKYVKKIAKNYANGKLLWSRELIHRYSRIKAGEFNKKKFVVKSILETKCYKEKTKGEELKKLLKHCKINPISNERYFYSIDPFSTDVHVDRVIVNTTIDWEKIINNPLKHFYIKGSDEFAINNNEIVSGILDLLSRSVGFVEKSNISNKDNIVKWLRNMGEKKAESLEEAFQRILFINSVLWQTSHNLVGLGRIDYYLNDVYIIEKKKGVTEEKIKQEIKDFIAALHEYYWFKSGALMGDTGQIFVLGGKLQNGEYFCNKLTYLFIEAIEELQLPDPKILLRYASNIPRDLLELAVRCIKTGVGCPLISNDELIIPDMIEFGYEPQDAYNYVTSACWEPLVPGVCHEQNNLVDIHYLLPLFFMSNDGDFNKINTYKEFVDTYLKKLDFLCQLICEDLDKIKWDKDPLISCFTDSCIEKRKDISEGGGKYNNMGVLSLGIANVVNSLCNIKKLVFDTNRYTLCELDSYRKNNFTGKEEILEILKNETKYFGSDNDISLELTQRIIDQTRKSFNNYRNCYGGKVKTGLSSPGYIMGSGCTEASFDGRKYGDPYSVHISTEGDIPFTQIMQFASKLDYSKGGFNGNVVDIMMAPNFIEDNFKKICDFLQISLNMGVFQMQINVVDSKTLIEAKKHPELYSNLIVRVWGFSAYFVELPDEYKEYLIKRALQNEKVA